MSVNENIIEIKPMKIDINDIFDKKIELSPLLEFTLLQKIIEELLNRQKETNDKIKQLENKININQNIMLPITTESMTSFPNDEENIAKEEKEIKENEDNDNNKDKEIDKGKTLLQINKNESKRANAFAQQILNRVILLENKFNELFESFDSFKKENKKETQTIKNKNKEYSKKISEIENMINDIQNKNEEENNVMAVIDDNDAPGNVDTDKVKVWIKNLEQKITKKIEFSDKRGKNNESSLNDLKEEINDIKNKLDNFELMIPSNTKKEDEGKKVDAEDDKKTQSDNFVTKEEFDKFKNELNHKFEENDKNILENPIKNINENNKFDESIIHKLGNMYHSLKESVTKSIDNTEKYVKNQIKKLEVDVIKKDIESIRKDLNTKLNQDNLNNINLKFEDLENVGDTLRTLVDDSKKDIRVINDKYSKLFKYLETIRGQVLSLLEQEGPQNKRSKDDYNLDLSSLLTREEFFENREKMNKKIDKILSQESDNYRMIQEIFKKLSNFVTETELHNLEQYFLNLLNETKIKIAKNYIEKTELQKNIKFLDIRIKQLEETTSKENENWLLAKKPMNGFLCASCEAYIGDLKNNEEVATWNKLTNKKGKRNYRIGHGFSTMLKLINSDLLKRAEKENNISCINNNKTFKLDENKKINHNLPRIKILQNQMNPINNEIHNGKINNSDTEENNENLNNSSNNLKTQIQFENNNQYIKGQLSERAINKRSSINYFQKDLTDEEMEPKMIKISKIKKI